MFVSPKTLALLLKLDIPKEDLVELFASLNEDAQMMQLVPAARDDADAVLAERRAADRERKRRLRNVRGMSAEMSEDNPLSSPEEKGFPEPLPKTQTLSNPHPPIVPPPLGEKPKVVARNTDFEAWYGRYPHKVGRAAAEKAFRTALTKTNLDGLMAGLEVYIRTKPADREWCNPATWLNQERWLDLPAAASKPKRVGFV